MTADASTDPTTARGPLEKSAPPAAPGAPAPDGPTSASPVRGWASAARLTSLGLYVAAAGHVGAALVHLSHGWLYSVFFLAVALAQVIVAGRVARCALGTGALGTVLGATLVLLLLYVASRTVPLPFGGAHGAFNDRPEDPDLLGSTVVVAELLVLAAGPALLPAVVRRLATTVLLLVGAGLWASWATGVL
jgi:hypothetical protein